jgi:predicted secreted Zn-dependent protease
VLAETALPVELRETFRVDTYPVSGRSAAEIRADLNRAGPLSVADAKRFDALTTWNLKWSLRFDRSGGGCSLAEATILLDIIVLLPELTDPAELSPRTMATWKAYREALDAHEMGHVENQRQGAAALQIRFNEFEGVWESCRELTAALKAEGDAVIQTIFAADRAHDESTLHGRLQGAVFP